MYRMSAAANLSLYITAAHPCPYLPEREATNLLVDPGYRMTPSVYEQLLQEGFRRSGSDVYRPYCKHCDACIATRIPVAEFRPNRSQRRTWQRNQDLHVVVNRRGFRPEYTSLYHRYISQRHAGGGMDSDSIGTFANFLLTPWCKSALVEFHAGAQLLAVAAVDELRSGLSAVYTFFDPVEGAQRGLGTYAVFWQIEQAKRQGLPYVYPGYWIADAAKMRYKARFQPLEGLVGGRWVRLPEPEGL